MKSNIKYILLLLLPILMAGVLQSCSEDETAEGGEPLIRYVRVTNPDQADSLLVKAYMGNLIAIIGENLGDTREIWFNDQQASLNPTYVTDKSILVNIPNKTPLEVNNFITLIDGRGKVLTHQFQVTIPAPVVVAMSNEYAEAGDVVRIEGAYFYEPTTVTFSGDVPAEIISMDEGSIEVVVPEGAEPGPITLTSNFGSTVSSLHYMDQRNIILNYDDLTAEGSWRPGPIGNENGIDGNYLKLFGTLDANQRLEDNFESQFWGHTRYPEKRNLFEGYPEDYVLKFEARVVEWYGSYLQVTWGPWDNAGNQEVWSNLNGRGLWRPWEAADAKFSTNGEWITVAIPLDEMVYSHNQENGINVWEPDMKFDKDIAGTLSFWVIATPKADSSPVEIHIDNVRIVEK